MQRVMPEHSAALIAAAGKPAEPGFFDPTQKIGELSILERVIATFQKAGIHEIVIVTGFAAKKIERHLSRSRVICLRNDSWKNSDLFASAKIGFSYLQDHCEQLLFTPVNVPLFSVDTVTQLLAAEHSACVPVFCGKEGYPLLLKRPVLKEITEYSGSEGLFGALALADGIASIEVADQGILLNLQNSKLSPETLAPYLRQPVMPLLSLALIREKIFFDEETCLLLNLISRTHSVRLACQQMNLSYSQGWRLLNRLEHHLGSPVIERHQGGKDGGWSTLTEYGFIFLERYMLMHRQLDLVMREKFEELFSDVLL